MAGDEVRDHERRYRELKGELQKLGFISRGSVVQRYTSCGKPGCRCTAEPPQLHGPYHQWTTKVDGKTMTRRLTAEEAALYERWIANGRQLNEIVAEMETTSRRAIELLLRREKS